MRKPELIILAALLLLLSACGSRPTVTPGSATPPPMAPGTPATGSAPISADSPPVGSASVSASAPATGGALNVILPSGALPKTSYAPPSVPPRLNAEVTGTLIPGNDYGRLWPYVGGYAVQAWMSGDILGLCDEQGRVVCAPVYNRVEIIENDGHKLYKLTENRQGADRSDISRITLATLDGKWAKDYEGVVYKFPGPEFFNGCNVQWRPSLIYDAISVCINGKWGVIDYDGTEKLPCRYNNPLCFSGGLAAVISDDGQTYVYIDIKGNTMLGPYETPPIQKLDNLPEPETDPVIAEVSSQTLRPYYGLFFSNDMARYYENGKYGLIDQSGTVLVPAQYDFVVPLAAGVTETVTGSSYENFKYGLIDTSGHVLAQPSTNRFEFSVNGTAIINTPQGSFSIEPKTGEQKPWVNPDRKAASIMSGPGGVVIDWGGGKKLSIPDATEAVLLDNGNIALSNRNSGTWYIADSGGKTLAGPFKGQAENYRAGFIYVTVDTVSSHGGSIIQYKTLYDIVGNRILPDVYLDILPLDGRFLVRQDSFGGLLDEKGNWIIKTPLYDYLCD